MPSFFIRQNSCVHASTSIGVSVSINGFNIFILLLSPVMLGLDYSLTHLDHTL